MDRAEATFCAITERLYSPTRHLFGRRSLLFTRTYEDLWPFANAWSAACTLASLNRSPSLDSILSTPFDGLAAYHRSHSAAFSSSGPLGFESVVVPPLSTGGDTFFDDNAWLGLALLCHHDVTGDGRALSLAIRLFAFLRSGWSTAGSWIKPGGVRWKQPVSNTSRNTCSNGPTAELAALLCERTGDTAAREWSIRTYEWVRDALLSPDGLYFDRITPDGTVSKEIWSYNQGTMIGTGVLLHRLTGERIYLEQAGLTATAAVARFGIPELLGQDAAFNAIFFRNLLLLDEAAPDPGYRELAAQYADAMWQQRRDPRSGLFAGRASPLNDSAPLVEIYGLVAGARPHP